MIGIAFVLKLWRFEHVSTIGKYTDMNYHKRGKKYNFYEKIISLKKDVWYKDKKIVSSEKL